MQVHGTWNSLLNKTTKIEEINKKIFKINEKFKIGDLEIYPFPTPHDAKEPCGFNIYNGFSKISIATDIGHIDIHMLDNLKNSSFLMIESNYDPNILKVSPYPYNLKKRISGPSGHLSNDAAGETISKLINLGLKDVLLIHLSKENNVPELAYETIMEKLKISNFNENSINLQVAPRDTPSQIFKIM